MSRLIHTIGFSQNLFFELCPCNQTKIFLWLFVMNESIQGEFNPYTFL